MATSDQTHFRSEEVHQSISGSRQSEGTDHENSQHQVRECGCHIHSLKHAKCDKARINYLFLHLPIILIGLYIFFSRKTYLSHGLDAFDEADVDHTPGAGQTNDHPPLQGAAGLNVRCDVQGLTVPEVIHWSALLTLHIIACMDEYTSKMQLQREIFKGLILNSLVFILV